MCSLKLSRLVRLISVFFSAPYLSTPSSPLLGFFFTQNTNKDLFLKLDAQALSKQLRVNDVLRFHVALYKSVAGFFYYSSHSAKLRTPFHMACKGGQLDVAETMVTNLNAHHMIFSIIFFISSTKIERKCANKQCTKKLSLTVYF